MKKQYKSVAGSYLRAAVAADIIFILSSIAYAYFMDRRAALAGVLIGLGLLVYTVYLSKIRKENITEYMDEISKMGNGISGNVLTSFPIPMAVMHIDGSIIWYNQSFSELFDNDNLFGKRLDRILKGLKWGEILKSISVVDKSVQIDDKQYQVTGNIIKNTSSSDAHEEQYSVYIYLIDKTQEFNIQKLYEDEQTDVAVINVDNYDDILQKVSDEEQSKIDSGIRTCIDEWAKEGCAIIKKTDRDRYFVMFEHKYLEKYIENKFDVLGKVRAVGEKFNMPISISIGIGSGMSLAENESSARAALDLALGRGGDQVSVKDAVQYRFFGGKTKEYEKSTRVKTRAVAIALKDFIKKSDNVILMGHSNADYDSMGAALGLQRAVRVFDKTPYIVYDNNSPAVSRLYDDAREKEEYKGMFISPEEAMDIVSPNTLLIILDTNRPRMLPCPELLNRSEKVVLIDHHRRATDFISPCSLMYHEPYASSTCEMVTELLEYMDAGSRLSKLEAEALYTGILIDTKNFILKTGVRTFEAASYLRRLGLNTVEVKKLFNTTKEDYDRRVDIVKTAKEISGNIAYAYTDKSFDNIKVIASQAADDMLNINTIKASFVLYPWQNGIGVSARSLGDINVQLIMEYMGGGGHLTVAGAQLRDKNLDEAVEMLKFAVKKYQSEE